MKVTVTFGDTAVVVPCKAGWIVRDLVEQATRRYRRILEQHGDSGVKTHHLEYAEGGILDMDDLLSDLVEDRDKLVAVFDRVQPGRTDSPRENLSNYSSAAPSPEPVHYYPHPVYQDPSRGEIEVNEAVLRGNTPLMVRSSSESALARSHERADAPAPPVDRCNGSPEQEVNHVLKGALDRLRTDDPPPKMSKVNFSTPTRTVEIAGDQGPLGIHVIPYCSSLSGRTLGLLIKGIEERSRSKRENIFQDDECIVQINDTPLEDKTFAESQEVFRRAMSNASVRLEVVPVSNKLRYEKSLIGHLFAGDAREPPAKASPLAARAKADPQQGPKPLSKPNSGAEARRADARAKTPEPPQLPPDELQSSGSSSPTPSAWTASSSPASRSPVPPGLANLTSKKGGKRLKIDLKKGAEGLGFTVVTRDSSVHGPGPILVKNILSRGAAVKDGRLQSGDRILEVNGVDMTGRSQEELVAMLRSTKQGENVCVVVVRQEDIFLPRELRGEETGGVVLEDGRERLMYEVPLNESGSAGLGVSLKGNKSRETGEDLGIFIKSVIHGGAAYKDGRLSVNDQLVAVNGESLVGRSNHAAMETLRRSMSSEGNARGTIQLVVLRAPRQMGSAASSTDSAPRISTAHRPDPQAAPSYQEPWNDDARQEPAAHVHSYAHGSYGSAPRAAAATNGGYSHEDDDEPARDFPPPPSPGAAEEMTRGSPRTSPHPGEPRTPPRTAADLYREVASDGDNVPRSRASKSMDMVADESNMGSLVGQKNGPSAAGALGPTLGLWKSSSLESLQTAVAEAEQSRRRGPEALAPFHRPRPHVVRGRSCNQSFRIAIDKSYDGPSEDDDDMSEQSSGHETPGGGGSSSRHGLDGEAKTKGNKKAKKSKGKKKGGHAADDPERKTKKKGFGLLRFGKKKDDKSKEAAKASKGKLEALSEEEPRDGHDPRYAELRSGHAAPDPAFLPDVEDDDGDPNYARISNFRRAPSPQPLAGRAPSPAAASAEDLDGLYAKVNKSRAGAGPNQHRAQANSDQHFQGQRREHQPSRAAPVYEELDAARRRALEYNPNRMAPRGVEPRPAHRHDAPDRHHAAQPRRDPYDYPAHSRPVPRDAGPRPSQQGAQYEHPASGNPRHYPSAAASAAARQDAARDDYYEAAGGRAGRRDASPGRYTSPERRAGERYASPGRYTYRDDRQPDPRRKNPVIGAV